MESAQTGGVIIVVIIIVRIGTGEIIIFGFRNIIGDDGLALARVEGLCPQQVPVLVVPCH